MRPVATITLERSVSVGRKRAVGDGSNRKVEDVWGGGGGGGGVCDVGQQALKPAKKEQARVMRAKDPSHESPFHHHRNRNGNKK